jgi:hypothetical protein
LNFGGCDIDDNGDDDDDDDDDDIDDNATAMVDSWASQCPQAPCSSG